MKIFIIFIKIQKGTQKKIVILYILYFAYSASNSHAEFSLGAASYKSIECSTQLLLPRRLINDFGPTGTINKCIESFIN